MLSAFEVYSCIILLVDFLCHCINFLSYYFCFIYLLIACCMTLDCMS